MHTQEENTIQNCLKGIDAEFDRTSPKKIKMVRHADSRTNGGKKYKELRIHGIPFPSNIPNLYALYIHRKDLFLQYQGEQLQRTFDGIRYIVSFIGGNGTESRFVGVYEIVGCSPSPYSSDEVLLDLKSVDAFSHLEEKIIIDWGKSTVGWHQYYHNKKTVIRIEDRIPRDEILPSSNSFQDAVLNYYELKQAVIDPNWVAKLKSAHCIYAISDASNGKLYVGSTYNFNGIFGRWESYAKTGHGDDKDLMELLASDESYARDNFSWTILELLPLSVTPADAIAREKVWKTKLNTIKHGYNNN